jgi:hypothetical protein
MEAMQVQEVGLYLRGWQKAENVGKNTLMGGAERLAQSERDKRDPVKIELAIKFGSKSRNFGAQSSLSVRPFAGVRGGTGTGCAGFRFVMLMTSIVFGPDLNERSY